LTWPFFGKAYLFQGGGGSQIIFQRGGFDPPWIRPWYNTILFLWQRWKKSHAMIRKKILSFFPLLQHKIKLKQREEFCVTELLSCLENLSPVQWWEQEHKIKIFPCLLPDIIQFSHHLGCFFRFLCLLAFFCLRQTEDKWCCFVNWIEKYVLDA